MKSRSRWLPPAWIPDVGPPTECRGCDAIYQRHTKSFPMGDSDTVNCEACGTLLERYHGGYLVMYKRIASGKPPKP